MKRYEIYFLVKSFVVWRVVLFLAAAIAVYLIPVFGARFPYYDRILEITKLPSWIWGFGNFDGVHYLRIAQDGYSAQYSQAFFPLYPILIRIFSFLIPKSPTLDTSLFVDPSFFYSGLILSNVFLLAALYVYYKLVSLDFKKEIAVWSVIFLLVFPTSYYFGSIYTESLFLFLTVISIYFMRKGKFLWASLLILLSTATRIIGVFLIPIFIIEVVKSKRIKNLWWILLSPLGILVYMLYLKEAFNNPLYFLTAQPIFGAGRLSDGIILLPQVIYRYLKIFVSTGILSLIFFTAATEFVFTLVPLTLLLFYIKKVRLSYWIFSVCALLVPTLTGTFSSMPRYALISMVLFIPYLAESLKRKNRIVAVISAIIGLVLVGLFTRGYWVA